LLQYHLALLRSARSGHPPPPPAAAAAAVVVVVVVVAVAAAHRSFQSEQNEKCNAKK